MDSKDTTFDELTKSQQYILSVLYKSYLKCLETDASKKECNSFEDASTVHSKFFIHLKPEDVKEDLFVLKEKDFIEGISVSNTILSVKISDKTIVYFENRFKNNLKDLADIISKLSSLIPGL